MQSGLCGILWKPSCCSFQVTLKDSTSETKHVSLFLCDFYLEKDIARDIIKDVSGYGLHLKNQDQGEIRIQDH